MKYSHLFFLMILLLTVSCGEKGDSGKASFKLAVGSIMNASADSFTGGLLIMGRRADGAQSFILPFTTGLELDLQKGAWEFATIGWTAAVSGKMTGPQQCSHQQVELRDDLQIITFNMSTSNCVNSRIEFDKEFADSQYMKLTNGSGTIGFKKTVLSVCSVLDDSAGTCSLAYGSSTINSYKVIIPPDIKGINYSAAQALLSDCNVVSSGSSYSNLTLPVGGNSGFLKMDLKLYNSGDCSGTVQTYSYQHGLAKPLAGISMMSPRNAFPAATFHYLGEWSSGGFVTGGARGDVYLITTAATSSPSATIGSKIFFDGSSWSNSISGQISIIGGRIYFDGDANSYLFVKQ